MRSYENFLSFQLERKLKVSDDDDISRPHEIETYLTAARRTGADGLSNWVGVFQKNPEETIETYVGIGGSLATGMFSNL